MRSPEDEMKLMRGFVCVEQIIRSMVFERPPEFKLYWTDSGHGVALYINGEPWAFVYEETHQGHSKGILKSGIGSPWNQELFKKAFTVG
jgi:beta-lactamase superfamily II metal-dependent hydrolase